MTQEQPSTTGPLLTPSELAAQARKFKEALEKMRRDHAPRPSDPREMSRRVMSEYLMRNPPRLHVVAAFAVDDRSGLAVVSAGAIKGKAMHTAVLRGVADDAPWMMLDHAIALVERHMPGRAAAFVVDSMAVVLKANAPTAEELASFDALRRRVCDALYERRSVVIFKSKVFAMVIEQSAWLVKAQHAADEELRRVVAETSRAEVSA